MLDRRQVVAGLGTLVLGTLVPKHLWAAAIKPDDGAALLVIDVQNCFLPGGSLAVKVVPSPGCDSAPSVPPWARMICCTM